MQYFTSVNETFAGTSWRRLPRSKTQDASWNWVDRAIHQHERDFIPGAVVLFHLSQRSLVVVYVVDGFCRVRSQGFHAILQLDSRSLSQYMPNQLLCTSRATTLSWCLWGDQWVILQDTMLNYHHHSALCLHSDVGIDLLSKYGTTRSVHQRPVPTMYRYGVSSRISKLVRAQATILAVVTFPKPNHGQCALEL